ncbi:MAG: HAMP domain-containing sensor histidine kinase [Bacteroidota bacterium]
MTLKRRIAIYSSLFFSIIFGVTSVLVFVQFSNFRKDEFRERLEEKALTSMKLLIEVQEVDKQLLQLIDRNSIHKLYNEKTLIFNDSFQLIYSSVDDVVIHWTVDDLRKLKEEKTLFKADGEYEVYGIYYDSQSIDYYALISAEDKYGKRKIQFLSALLIITFLVATSVVWIVSFNFTRKLVLPLDNFQQKITNISLNNLTERLEESNKKDEINLIAKAFNQMMFRIENAYRKQQEFTANASHELRTPIARITTQLENLEQLESHSTETKIYIENLKNDANQMADLITSLLLLSKVSDNNTELLQDRKRIDEIIFDAIAIVKKHYPDFYPHFELIENPLVEYKLDIICNDSLLRIAFVNLLKNAYLYSNDKKAIIEIEQLSNEQVLVRIKNNGEVLDSDEQQKLFQAFMRGKNSIYKPGSGLGLRISQRIFTYHGAQLNYTVSPPNLNQFEIILTV